MAEPSGLDVMKQDIRAAAGVPDLLRGGCPDINARALIADPRTQRPIVKEELVQHAGQLQPCSCTAVSHPQQHPASHFTQQRRSCNKRYPYK